ncbi:MAG: IS200/IS605 family transposase [Cyclobacteriaceae bacterium]
MAGTYTQIYIQCVFAVKHRQGLLGKAWRQEVFKYMSGIVTNKGSKSIIINGVSDHVHLFIGLNPATALSDLVRDVKNNSSKFINEQKWLASKFQWQSGYGAFSYAQSQLGAVYRYIENQEEHHRKKSFREEYHEFLKKYEIDHDERYLFEWLE